MKKKNREKENIDKMFVFFRLCQKINELNRENRENHMKNKQLSDYFFLQCDR